MVPSQEEKFNWQLTVVDMAEVDREADSGFLPIDSLDAPALYAVS